MANAGAALNQPKDCMQIENHCSDAPRGVVRQVRRCLEWIESGDLKGVAFICLMDQMPSKVTSVDSQGNTYGWYHLEMENTPPYIVLYIPNIYSGIPSFLWWTTIPTLRICRSLAHEVAHHVVAKRSYAQDGEKIEEEEAFANNYASGVLRRMTERWIYRLGDWCMKEMAGWYYAFGNVDWRFGRYSDAASRFFKAWDLDPQHEDAAYWYWRAKKIIAKEET